MDKISNTDIAVYVCPTCSAFLQEHPSKINSRSIWEFLDKDNNFPCPDYNGKTVFIQDCWRTYDNDSLHKAIRNILTKMNLTIKEIEASHNKADFCGITLLKNYSPRYKKFAPLRFIENAGDNFIPHTEEEQNISMKEHCKQFENHTVVCYCTGCLEGLNIGEQMAFI